jgi:hypothetical protein
MAVLTYKPHFTRIITLYNAIAMLKYPAFDTPLSCERLYKVSQTLPVNAVEVIAISIIIAVATAAPSFSCNHRTSLAALRRRDDLCL